MKNVTKWNQREFVKQTREKLVQRMDFVGEMVEMKAQARLRAIAEPAWGRRYRREYVGKWLTHVVEEEDDAITVTVGVKAGQQMPARQTKEQKRLGILPPPKTTTEDVGFWIEKGSKRARTPANYLRGSVFDEAKFILSLLKEAL